jgi:predicted extracellular nuclease
MEAIYQGLESSIQQVKRMMDEDPGVKEGVFVYEIHACRSFPGDCLPK